MRRKKIYAIYKGDKFVDVGTAEELAKRQNTTKERIYWYAYSKWWKNKKHQFEIIVLDDED